MTPHRFLRSMASRSHARSSAHAHFRSSNNPNLFKQRFHAFACVSQDDSKREVRNATERLVAARAQLGRTEERLQQLAVEAGANPDLLPVSDADADVSAVVGYGSWVIIWQRSDDNWAGLGWAGLGWAGLGCSSDY